MISFKYEIMKYAKYIIAVVILLGVFSAFAFSEIENVDTPRVITSSDVNMRDYIDEIAYYDLQMSAVSVDMYLYLGWASDEKVNMQKAAAIAIKRLDSIIMDVNSLNTLKEATDVKVSFIDAVGYLKEIYKNVEKKDDATIKKEFDTFNKKYSIYNTIWRKTIREDGQIKDIEQPEPIFPSKELNDNYSKALNLMKQKKYKEARDIFLSLKDRIDKNSIAYDYIVLNLSDISGKIAYNFEDVTPKDKSSISGDEEIIKYSEKILNKEYSPLFIDFFVRWRTATQSFHSGVSNLSNIPNWEYNLKRKELIAKIRAYVKDHPQDAWAKAQIRQILGFGNISRGGLMGNDTLNYIGMLYMPAKDKASPDEDKKDISEDSQDIPPSATIVE